jgi:hypothetical protein
MLVYVYLTNNQPPQQGTNCTIADETVSQLPDSRTEVISLSFGLLGAKSNGELLFDPNFNLDLPATQSRLVQVCDDFDALLNNTALRTKLGFRRLGSCLMRNFARDFVPQVGKVFPINDPTEFRETLKAFLDVNTGMKPYISMDVDTFKVKRVTITIKTGFDKQMGAASAVEHMKVWDAWITEYNSLAPASARVGMQSSFLWARASTESAAIRGT